MDKKGQIETVVGVALLVGVLLTGGITTYDILSENRYILDTSNGTIYDLAKCRLEGLDESNLEIIELKNAQEEIDKGVYKMAQCS